MQIMSASVFLNNASDRASSSSVLLISVHLLSTRTQRPSIWSCYLYTFADTADGGSLL